MRWLTALCKALFPTYAQNLGDFVVKLKALHGHQVTGRITLWSVFSNFSADLSVMYVYEPYVMVGFEIYSVDGDWELIWHIGMAIGTAENLSQMIQAADQEMQRQLERLRLLVGDTIQITGPGASSSATSPGNYHVGSSMAEHLTPMTTPPHSPV